MERGWLEKWLVLGGGKAPNTPSSSSSCGNTISPSSSSSSFSPKMVSPSFLSSHPHLPSSPAASSPGSSSLSPVFKSDDQKRVIGVLQLAQILKKQKDQFLTTSSSSSGNLVSGTNIGGSFHDSFTIHPGGSSAYSSSPSSQTRLGKSALGSNSSFHLSISCSIPNKWYIFLHGKTGSGKSTFSQSLSRVQQYFTASDTQGMTLRTTILPIKLQNSDDIHWILLWIEDVGSKIQEQYSYLQFSKTKPSSSRMISYMSNAVSIPNVPTSSIAAHNHVKIFKVHVVMFSMTDKDSLNVAAKIVLFLQKSKQSNEIVEHTSNEYHQSHSPPEDLILVVGSKVDDITNYQITYDDLEVFVEKHNVTLCLVNNLADFSEEQSSYSVVEELFSSVYEDQVL